MIRRKEEPSKGLWSSSKKINRVNGVLTKEIEFYEPQHSTLNRRPAHPPPIPLHTLPFHLNLISWISGKRSTFLGICHHNDPILALSGILEPELAPERSQSEF